MDNFSFRERFCKTFTFILFGYPNYYEEEIEMKGSNNCKEVLSIRRTGKPKSALKKNS